VPMTYDVSIVIPCYNEEAILEDSVREVTRVMDQTRYSWEMIFIDDRSHDQTPLLLSKLVLDRPNARAIFHPQNVGRGGTASEGLSMAQGRVIGFLDIDLEVHARYIPTMVQAIDCGYDVATAHRIYRVPLKWDDLLRNILSVGYRWMVRHYLKLPFEDTEAGFKFFRADSIRPLLQKARTKGWFWDTEIMALAHLAKLRVIEIPCVFVRRFDKVSTVRPFKDSWAYLVALLEFKRRVGSSTEP
jgi:glycosyltransferase involved in cell wall biosynthesis